MALSIGRIVGRLGEVGSSKAGLAALVGIGGMAGFANTAGPATMDAAMDVAFGTPDADRYFTGRDMSLRGTIGAAIGGPLGGAVMATAPGDYYATRPAMFDPVTSIAAGVGIGAVAGSMSFKRGQTIASKMLKGARGTLAGGIVGGIVGAAIPALGVKSYMSNNQQFFSQSPYSPSSARSIMELNATGDVVLGMHNARRGY